MKIKTIKDDPIHLSNNDLNDNVIVESVERYINNKGILKSSILRKFKNLKERNETKNKTLTEQLLLYNKKVEDVKSEIERLNTDISINIQKIKDSLS